MKKYLVTFIGFNDEDGLPISTEISVPKKYKDKFEDFLTKNQDEIFIHATGENIEF